ncbi:hypothetical protein MTR_4g073820 [Medicago truncatula]|uniref:RNase H type-1 domain-containing protein n=1 Tax=Medicago truncatula TaxID=3880 RepID=A0A072ULE2_MEDTR|nr:hypothetical protein MTR_4g073820 [Medicago truncatula]
MCIRDDEDRFVLVKMELPSSYVDLGEALGLLSALQWVRALHLNNIDFDMDSKIEGGKMGIGVVVRDNEDVVVDASC